LVVQGAAAPPEISLRAKTPSDATEGSAASSLAQLTGRAKGAKKGKTAATAGVPDARRRTLGGQKSDFIRFLKAKIAKAGAPGPTASGAVSPSAALTDLAAKVAAGRAGALSLAVPGQAADAAATAPGGTAKAGKAAGTKKPVPTHAEGAAPDVVALLLADSGKRAEPGEKSRTEPGSDVKKVTAGAHAEAREPVVRIVDLRTQDKKPNHATAAPVVKPGAQPAAADKDTSILTTIRPSQGRETIPPAEKPPAPVAQQTSFIDRLRDAAGPELLRAANLVLRDGGGEIRLVLKPESLGSVRIRMNLVDNKIEGRIIVDSSTVKHVFDASVDALRRALTAEGFQTGSLQVSVGGQGADADGRRDEQPQRVARAAAVGGFDRSVPELENVSLGDLLVNLFV
jgi:flagellar hook-length control protein FliK